MRSLLVSGALGHPSLVNRSEFYEHMSGVSGDGAPSWQAPIGDLVSAGLGGEQEPLDAGAAIADVGVGLLQSHDANNAQDLLVVFEAGVYATVGVVDVLSWLGNSYTKQAREVRHSERRLRALVQSGSDAVMVVDDDYRISYASPAYTAITGVDDELCVDSSFFLVIHPSDEPTLRKEFSEAMASNGHAMGRFRVRSNERGWRWCEYRARSMFNDPAIQGLVINFSDVDDRLKLEEDLRRQAWIDPLTELPNRALFVDRLDRAVERLADEPTRGVGLVYLDLDGFKVVNDSLGHQAGDDLLCEAGRRLRACARSSDTVARLGGDEFAVLLETTSEADPTHVARRLHESLLRRFEIQGQKVPVRASFGIVTHFGRQAVSGEELLRRADVAMYVAKASSRENIHVWSESADRGASAQLSLVADLASSIEAGNLDVEYQPYLDLETRQIRGAEALVRWQHPVRGRVMPDEFVPAAEAAGLIDELDALVLRKACGQAAAWFADGTLPVDGTISINVSAVELRNNDISRRVAAVLAETGLSPAQLQLEITETALIGDVGRATGTLETLRDMGVKVAIDDFGTGYGSMSYLRDLPVDLIKVDRSFVSGLDDDHRDALIVNGIVRLADALGMGIIAEGVETEKQVEVLRELGCTVAQGYHFARPMPPEDLVERFGSREEVSV